jgi:hypothetical protein
MNPKPPPGRRDGLRTTEFGIAVLACVLCAVALVIAETAAERIASVIGAVLSSTGYQVARAIVKAARIRVDRV